MARVAPQSYPALTLSADLLARIHAIEIRTRRLTASLLGGEYRSVFRGAGIELHEKAAPRDLPALHAGDLHNEAGGGGGEARATGKVVGTAGRRRFNDAITGHIGMQRGAHDLGDRDGNEGLGFFLLLRAERKERRREYRGQ